MLDRLPYFLLMYPLLLLSLSFHEAAHAWMADRYGDPTARLMGRISLNPIRHIDPIGTFLLPAIAMLTGARLIGWGKPVPVNPLNLRNPRKDNLWISALGPFSNIALACLFAALAWILVTFDPTMRYTMVRSFNLFIMKGAVTFGTKEILGIIIIMGVILNLTLAIFNLIPIYPLDGGGIIRGLLPEEQVPKFDAVAKYGIIILLALLITNTLRYVFIPVNYLTDLLLPF